MSAMVTVLAAVLLVCVVARVAQPWPRRDVVTAVAASPRRTADVCRWLRRRSPREPEPHAVAAWCDEIVRRLRSGSTMRESLAEAVPTDAAVRAATDSLRLAIARGAATADATSVDRDRGPHLRLVLAVIATTATLGGSPVQAIDRAAGVLRLRAADREDRIAQAAQARLSAHVLTAVPVIMLAVLVVSDADVRRAVSSSVGAACVAVGLALNAAGWLWMHRLVRPRW